MTKIYGKIWWTLNTFQILQNNHHKHMKQIKITTPNSDDFIQQFGALYSVFKNLDGYEQVDFDFTQAHWLSPIMILPIVAYIAKTNSQYNKSKNDDTNSYLKTICFPNGTHSVTEFEKNAQIKKNYVPISVLERNKGSEREHLETMFSNMIYNILGSVPHAQDAVYHPISELVTNIFDHSKEKNGFLFGQYYPKKEFLDICIVDTGRGLKQAYKDEQNKEVSDEQAIQEVLKGNSTKPGKERGYGVRTSKDVVCKGLGGQFLILSGSSALISSKSSQKSVSLPNFLWPGVIVAYRIPKPTGSIDIYQYLE
jgi:hypothetical protein